MFLFVSRLILAWLLLTSWCFAHGLFKDCKLAVGVISSLTLLYASCMISLKNENQFVSLNS